MMPTAKFIRFLAKLRFKVLGKGTIKDIPTERFNSLIEELQANGWEKVHEYVGIDAWIDYGCVKLKKGSIKLMFEWDNWTEGSVEGPGAAIKDLAQEIGLEATDKWRWAEYDDS